LLIVLETEEMADILGTEKKTIIKIRTRAVLSKESRNLNSVKLEVTDSFIIFPLVGHEKKNPINTQVIQ
jgi:ATP sulfurylase